AQEPAETTALNDALKRASDTVHKSKFSQARLLEIQGRGLRADKNPKGDWMKAAEAFKDAGAIYKEIDEKDDFARTLVEQGDCYRKDHKEPSKDADWIKAGMLYLQATTLFNSLGDKKNQAD